jgi:GntR family transcriptional regulator
MIDVDNEWDDRHPIYRQLRDFLVTTILDGSQPEGDVLPSVRNLAADFRVSPLTALKSYQLLVSEGLVESRRGRGMFVIPGARNRARAVERERFLQEEWPRVLDTLLRLGLNPEDLLQRAPREPASEPTEPRSSDEER